MSKSLRTVLLSVLIIVLACSSAMAATLTFKWTGNAGNYWGHATNWSADIDGTATNYAAQVGKIRPLANAIEFYPGKVIAVNASFDKVRVVISKDANISMTLPGSTGSVGGIEGVTSIEITGEVGQPAIVAIDMGANSWFETAPSITVKNNSTLLGTSSLASLAITSSRNPAFRISGDVKWEALSADLTLDFPVEFLSGSHLSLDVSDGNLTICENYTSILNSTDITIDKTSSHESTLSFMGDVTNNGKNLNIHLLNSAKTVSVAEGKTVTLSAYSGDNYIVSVDGSAFQKTGAGTLVFAMPSTYTAPAIPSGAALTVAAGTLDVSGTDILGRYTSATKFSVSSGATFNVGTKTLSSDKRISFDIAGTVNLAANAVNVNDVYTGGAIKVSSDIAVNLASTGVLNFKGTQALKKITGSGVIKSESGAMLLLDCGSADIADFSGTIVSLDIGIMQSYDVIPFFGTNESVTGDIKTLYVFHPAELSFNKAALDAMGVTGLENTGIYLRSNIPGSNKYTDLVVLKVGKIKISGDISLGVVSVDGTGDSTNVGGIEFVDTGSSLTIEKLVLHANAVTDFDALNASTNNYVNMYAVEITGPGTFTPKAMANSTGDSIHVGTDDSIIISNGATLVINEGVNFPRYNSVLLQESSLDIANSTKIDGNFLIDGRSKLFVYLNADNNRTFEQVSTVQKSSIIVGGLFTLSSDNLSVDVVKLDDGAKFLGKQYAIIGYVSRDIKGGTMTLVGAYAKDTTTATDDVFVINYDNRGVYAQMINWFVQPIVSPDWVWLKGDGKDEFGNASKQFAVSIGYGLSDDVQASFDLVSYLTPTLNFYYKGNKANAAAIPTNSRQQITDQTTGDNLAFIEFTRDLDNRKLVINGTSYKTSLDVRINLTWPAAGTTSYTALNTNLTNKGAWVTTKVSTGGSLANTEFDSHSGRLKIGDLVDLVDEKRVIIGPEKEPSDDPQPARSPDQYPDVTPTIVSPTTVFEANASADFEFSIPGLTATPVTAAPTLMNGVYVWNNGISSTDKYMFNGEEVTNIQVYVNDEPIPMADVTLTPDANGNMVVSIPVSLLGSSNGYLPAQKSIKVTAKAVSDNATFNIQGPTVTIRSAYTDGTVFPEQQNRTVKVKDLPTDDQQIAEYSMTDPVSADAEVDGGAKPEWLTLKVSGGVVAYALTANAPVGTHDITIHVWNAEGAYQYKFTVTVEEGFKVASERVFDTIGGLNYEAHFTTNAPAGTAVEWTFTPNDRTPAGFKSVVSGDTFVVYGVLPAYINDDEAENDPNEYSYTVTATAGDESDPATDEFTVEEDTDDTIAYGDFTAGTITPNGNISEMTADYSVEITFSEDYYDTDLAFLSLPYWLTATPKTAVIDETETITGYVISYKSGAEVDAGESGVVRFEDPGDSRIVSWSLTSASAIGKVGDEFMYSVTGNTTLSVALAARDTSITIQPRNVLGTVSYASSASWVSVNETTGVVAINPTDSSLVSSTPHTVTITLTDSGRTEKNTQTVTLTITVTAGGVPTPLEITANQTELTLAEGETATVTMSANLDGVSYTSDKGWAAVNGNTVTITAPSADDTATITGRTADGRTATATIKVTVSNVPTQLKITANPTELTFTEGENLTQSVTMTANLDGVTYTSNKGWAVVNGSTVMVSAPEASDTVTITGTTTDGRTDTATITVTVNPRGFSLAVSPRTVRVSEDETITVTLTPSNATGTVSYTANQTWVTFSGNTATITAPEVYETTTYTVTITATDSAGETATATVTVIVETEEINTNNPGGSSGGCDAGFGALALALAAPLFLRRRRS